MFFIETAKEIEVDQDIINVVIVVIAIFALYFFSFNIQKTFANAFKSLSKKLGVYSTDREYKLQKYVYQHHDGLVAKLYRWVNQQLIALGLKRVGVTVFGYLLFWFFVSLIGSVVIDLIMQLGFFYLAPLSVVVFVIALIMTRVVVSERITRREASVMNAVDLIIPEIRNGVKNAIIMYKDKFSDDIREDFQAFVTNIQDRGFNFADAMFILDDNLGYVFHDFAQKAVYFEQSGEIEMLDIFADITETNRLRRTLRAENATAFASLTSSFVVSTIMVIGYFIFIVITDAFSRHFFLQETFGKVLLLIMALIVFCVLSYISTIKSQDI